MAGMNREPGEPGLGTSWGVVIGTGTAVGPAGGVLAAGGGTRFLCLTAWMVRPEAKRTLTFVGVSLLFLLRVMNGALSSSRALRGLAASDVSMRGNCKNVLPSI